MRIRLGDLVLAISYVERDSQHVFFRTYTDDVYIIQCDTPSQASVVLSQLFYNGYVDISAMYVMDKEWRRI